MSEGASNLDITNPVFRAITDQALREVPAAEGSFLELLDGDDLVCTTGSGTLAYLAGLRLSVHASLSGLAVLTRSPVRCEDSATDPLVDRDAARKAGAVSFVCVPIQQGDQTMGALVVSSSVRRAFDDDDVQALIRLAGLVFSPRHTEGKLSRLKKFGARL